MKQLTHRENWSCLAESIRMCISTCHLWELTAATITRPELEQLYSAAPQRLSISFCKPRVKAFNPLCRNGKAEVITMRLAITVFTWPLLILTRKLKKKYSISSKTKA